MPLVPAAADSNDGIFQTGQGDQIQVSYTDPVDGDQANVQMGMDIAYVGKKTCRSGGILIRHVPFSNSVTVVFPGSADNGRLYVHDLNGDLVAEIRAADGNSVIWTAPGRGSGVYYLRAEAEGRTMTWKLVL